MKKLLYNAIIFLFVSTLVGCGPARLRPTSVMERSLEEGRVVVETDLQEYEILNAYSHLLPEPKDELLKVNLISDQSSFLGEGGNTTIQIGLATKKTTIGASNIHFLGYYPEIQEEESKAELEKLLQSIQQSENSLVTGSTITFDWKREKNRDLTQYDSLLESNNSDSLEKFLRPFLIHPFDGRKHRIILLLGEKLTLSGRSQQNLWDMASILRAKGITVSVLVTGEKPHYVFLEQFVTEGGGQLGIVTDSWDFNDWMRDEINDLHAFELKDIRLKLTLHPRVSIEKKMFQAEHRKGTSTLEINLPSMRSGEQRVFPMTVSIPKKQSEQLIVGKVETRYLYPAEPRFYSGSTNLTVRYTDDINKALLEHNPLIQRSLLIIETGRVMKKVTRMLQEKRVYKGMAILAEHGRKLKKVGQQLNDRELLKDAEVFEKYEKRLYKFSEESFQDFKIWMQSNFGEERFKSGQ